MQDCKPLPVCIVNIFLTILLMIFLNVISGCAVTSSLLQSKEDQLYHAGRYEELISQIKHACPEHERQRILAENKARVKANQSTGFNLIYYHFYTRYLIYSLIETGKFDEALQLCNRTIEECRTLSMLFQQYHYSFRSPVELNDETLARLQLYKGYITWFRTGDYDQSFKYFSDIKLEILPPKDKIYVLLDRGFFYDKIIGDYPKAINQFEEVIRLTKTLGLFDIDSKYAYSLQAYRRIMLIYTKLGQLEQAKKILDEYELSTGDIAFKFGKMALSSSQYFRGYLSMMDASAGALFALSRDFDKSKKYFNKAWNVVKNIDIQSQDMWDQNALGTYFVLYGTYYLGLQNKYREAVECVDRGLKHLKPYYIEAIETEIDIESTYLYSAELHYILGNKQMALSQVTEAIKYSERYYNRITAARAYTLVGQIYLNQGDLKEAKDAYNTALRLIGKVESTENWKLFFGLGQVYEQSDDTTNAISFYKYAVEEVEKLWDGRFKDTQKQLSFLENRLSVYEPLTRLLISQRQAEEAVAYMEKSKSRTFYETSPYYTRDNDTKKNVGYLEESPKSALFSKTLTVKEIKAMLPTDTVLLEYYVGEKIVVGATISNRNGVHAQILPLTAQQLKGMVKKFRNTIDYPVGDKSYIEVGAQLYDLLVKPFEKYLSGHQRLGIIPHGILHYLPFQALVASKEGKPEEFATEMPQNKVSPNQIEPSKYTFKNRPVFLLDHYAIFYSPSATILGIAKHMNTNRHESLLAVGSPPDITVKDSSSQILVYEKLPFAEAEILQVSNFFKNKKTFIDTEATETIVKNQAANYDILLFPVHGEFNRQQPLKSCLFFNKDSNNDGVLTVGEVEKIHLNATLVVLSACESGMVASYGGISENLMDAIFPLGDDLVGFQRAFIKSGSASLLSTLWKVNSNSTALLITKFFELYTAGTDKASALQAAQIYLMQLNRDWMRPYYWAPFVLSGDWR
jgi:CHAT domain-containing protein